MRSGLIKRRRSHFENSGDNGLGGWCGADDRHKIMKYN